jgi:hypothetical protein
MSTEKEKVQDEVQDEVVNSGATPVDEAPKEPVEILEYPYEQLVIGIQEYVKNLGQMTWITDNEAVEGEKSKTISIARVLSNGQKQLLEITVEQKTELVFK